MLIVVEHNGRFVALPFSFPLSSHSIEGRFPNEPMLKMDELKFDSLFGRHAEWVQGDGPFAVLAYCGRAMTITRWPTIERAVRAKQIIDGSGCGGGCCKVHVIVEFDPENNNHRREHAAIEEYVHREDYDGDLGSSTGA